MSLEKGEMSEKTKTILRWVFFIPGAVLVSFLESFFMYYFALLAPLSTLGAISVQDARDSIPFQALCLFLFCIYTFVPKYKARITGLFAFAYLVISLGAALLLFRVTGDWGIVLKDLAADFWRLLVCVICTFCLLIKGDDFIESDS